MASIWTTEERDEIKVAIKTAAISGFASVSIAGQSVQSYSLDQLTKLLEKIEASLAADTPGGGIRRQKIMPYYR